MPGRAEYDTLENDALKIYMLIYIVTHETRTMTPNMTLSSYSGVVI